MDIKTVIKLTDEIGTVLNGSEIESVITVLSNLLARAGHDSDVGCNDLVNYVTKTIYKVYLLPDELDVVLH
jgi:hypothetical protein